MTIPTGENDKRLPVTLLSGFLGSGKTTLLSNILKSKDHGLRCALIVNDMGALNIDASLIKNHKLTQQGEKIVQMQNGCICCTLRADLLEEIAKLAEMGSFDYLLIESSGISEPIQVAETFTSEFAESVADQSVQEIYEGLPADGDTDDSSRLRLAQLIKDGGLSKVARLDTCVTVVDCTTFLADFDTTDFLTDRLGKDVDPEDERNITDLLTDQLEFANIIILNKTDVVSKAEVDKAEALVKTLNPDAKIFRTSYSKVPIAELLNTNLFDFNKASVGAGWLQSLREVGEYTDAMGVVKMIPEPETEDSFVYTARRPFHPKRLWELMKEPFCILQNPSDTDDDDASNTSDDACPILESKEAIFTRLQAEKAELDLPARIAFKRASPIWSGVLRSKGFIWLATRPRVSGEWSQAGCMWTLNGGAPWMCAVDEAEWPTEDEQIKELIKKDFFGPWGDRRQEGEFSLVFIGQSLDQDLITRTLNTALLDDAEWVKWEKLMNSRKKEEKKMEKLYEMYDDGWEEWDDGTEEHLDNEAQDFKQLESEGQEAGGVKHIHAEHDHAHVGHKAKKTKV